MARIRSIKPKAFTSRDLVQFPREIRWTVAGLWTYCDDEGRADADPRMIKAAIYPRDDNVTPEVIERELSILERGEHICRYTVDGDDYFHVVKFKEHQHPNRPVASELPECPHAEHPPQRPEPDFAHGLSSEPAVSRHEAHTAVVVVGGEVEVELEVDTPTALVLRDEQRATPPAGETLNKRAQRLTKTYADRNKMLNFPAVMGVVKKAIHAGHEDDQIVAALGRLAEDGRSVTTETLRIELEGLPARRSVSTTDRRVEAAQALKGTFGTDQLAIGAS